MHPTDSVAATAVCFLDAVLGVLEQAQSPSGASLSAARRFPEPSRAKRLSPLDLQTTESVVGSEMRTYGFTRPETRSDEVTVQTSRVLCSPVRGESTGQLFVAQQLAADPSQVVLAHTFRGEDATCKSLLSSQAPTEEGHQHHGNGQVLQELSGTTTSAGSAASASGDWICRPTRRL